MMRDHMKAILYPFILGCFITPLLFITIEIFGFIGIIYPVGFIVFPFATIGLMTNSKLFDTAEPSRIFFEYILDNPEILIYNGMLYIFMIAPLYFLYSLFFKKKS